MYITLQHMVYNQRGRSVHVCASNLTQQLFIVHISWARLHVMTEESHTDHGYTNSGFKHQL